MKKIVYFVIIGLVFTVFACKKGADSYVFSRPTHPQNFKTVLDGELYTYTADDNPTARADYYLIVEGDISSYGDTIIKFGHCWSSSVLNPILEDADSATSFIPNPFITDTSGYKFESVLTNLDAGTDYYVRTYVVTANGTIGYNPTTTVIPTKPAIDEWFELFTSDKPIAAARTDALVFNFGDTVFFGTGQEGNAIGLLNDIIMFDPRAGQNGEWNAGFIKGLTDNDGKGEGLMNGIGFAIAYQKRNAPAGQITRSIFVGIGDHGGFDNPSDKSRRLMEYDLSENSWSPSTYAFPGRSNAVAFVLNGIAYVGTGKSTSVLSDWFIFDPVENADVQSPLDITGWRGMGATSTPTQPRKDAIAFTIGGTAYFGLGTDGNGTFYKDFYSFTPDKDDPAYGIWRTLAEFPGEARANAVAFAIGDQGYVGCGDNIEGNMETVPYPDYGGVIFNDFYRYDPFTDRWSQIRDYTANKVERLDAIRPITRAIGFAIQSQKIGYVGYGLEPLDYPIPNPPASTSSKLSQKDFWKYQPFDDDAKK